MKRMITALLLAALITSTADAGKRIKNYPRDQSGPANAHSMPRPCSPRSPLESGGAAGERWLKGSVRTTRGDAARLLAGLVGIDVATALPLLASVLDDPGADVQVTFEIRVVRQ